MAGPSGRRTPGAFSPWVCQVDPARDRPWLLLLLRKVLGLLLPLTPPGSARWLQRGRAGRGRVRTPHPQHWSTRRARALRPSAPPSFHPLTLSSLTRPSQSWGRGKGLGLPLPLTRSQAVQANTGLRLCGSPGDEQRGPDLTPLSRTLS